MERKKYSHAKPQRRKEKKAKFLNSSWFSWRLCGLAREYS
jgi:hypothetical protein